MTLQLSNIRIDIDSQKGILWLTIGSPIEMHYSYETICSFYDSLDIIKDYIKTKGVKHILMVSANKEVWNMGGDLAMFANAVLEKKEDIIRDYAYKCIEVVSAFNNGFNSGVITTSVVQDNAFGGGFECALSGDYIIAEEQAKFSFPEVLFGTFPGMGAYSFLTRRVGFAKAQEMISTGKKWTALEMQQIGLVDLICEPGKAIDTILEKIRNNELSPANDFKKICRTVPKNELLQIVDIWLDTTLRLDADRVIFMQKIAEAQKTKMKRMASAAV